MAINLNDDREIFDLKIDVSARKYISGSVNWAKFIAILFTVLLVLFSGLILFVNYYYLPEVMQTGQQWSVGSVTFMISFVFLFNFFPIFYLLRFCSAVKKAMQTNDQVLFTKALRFLRNHFRAVGIAFIVFVGLYILGSVVTAIKGI